MTLLVEVENESYLLFWCPGCQSCHYVDERWTVTGTLSNPTVSPSVLCPRAPRCHLFIEAGRIEYLTDCDHALAGQTVDMVPLDGEPN